MATITKRGDTYKITASCGYNISGKQIRKHMTWTPDPGMTAKQIAKELDRQKVLFEEKCKTGQILDGSIRFLEFSEMWFSDYADKQLRPKTLSRYKSMMPRINAAIGHIKLDKLQPHHLMIFYTNLEESGVREDYKYYYDGSFKQFLVENKISKVELSKQSGVGVSTLNSLTQGKNISPESANRIASYFQTAPDALFKRSGDDSGLSPKTILHHHRLISSILSTAVKWQIIFSNPCDRVQAPKVSRNDAKYLDEVEAARLLDLLDHESIQNRTIVKLLLYTGMRRGELCGLEWCDINFETDVITIRRSSLYLPEKGVFVDETKNESSLRSIKAPVDAMQALKAFRAWQSQQILALGDQWKNSGRIFTALNGAPIHPDTITQWFHKFITKNNLPNISIHSLRHTNATLLIAAGTNLQTVANRLGHANVATTGKIYAHAIKSADAAAAETLQNILQPIKKKA